MHPSSTQRYPIPEKRSELYPSLTRAHLPSSFSPRQEPTLCPEMDTPQDALQAPQGEAEPVGGTEPLTGRARSLANLRPPWTPEQARAMNPSGLTKRGTPAKTAKLDQELENQMAKRMATRRLVQRWIRDAIEDEDGSVRAKAREQILQRLYPVPQDAGSKRVVLEGLKLELSPQGGASVTVLRAAGEGPGLPAPAESFASSEASESRAGGADALNALSETRESQTTVGPLPGVEVPTLEGTSFGEGRRDEAARGDSVG